MNDTGIRTLKNEVRGLCDKNRMADAIRAVHDAFGDKKFHTATQLFDWMTRDTLLRTLYEEVDGDAHDIYEHTGQKVGIDQFRYLNDHGDHDMDYYFDAPVDLSLVGEAIDMIDTVSREAPQYYDFSRGIQGVYHIGEDDIIDLIEAYGQVIEPPRTIQDLRERTEALWDHGGTNQASRFIYKYLDDFDMYAFDHDLETRFDLIQEIQADMAIDADDKASVAKSASRLQNVRGQDAYLYRVNRQEGNDEKPRPAHRDEVLGAFQELDKVDSYPDIYYQDLVQG